MGSVALAIADDRNPSVRYIGTSWKSTTNASLNDFSQTRTCTQANAAKGTFNFQGTSVSVFGAPLAMPSPTSGSWNVTYTVDGHLPQTSTWTNPSPGGTLFTKSDLSDGNHTLMIELGDNMFEKDGTLTYCLDYFTFKPSPSTLPLVTSIVDDLDFVVEYSIGWEAVGSEDAQSVWGNSLHRTVEKGSTAQLQFQGSRVSVFGVIVPPSFTNSSTISSYSIDNGPAVSFTAGRPKATQYGVKFFDSGPIPDSTHVLDITTETEGTPIFLDYFLLNASMSINNVSMPIDNVSSDTSKPLSLGIGTRAAIIIISLFMMSSLSYYYRRHRAGGTVATETVTASTFSRTRRFVEY